MECKNCGAVSDWEFWDEVGRQRYVGGVSASWSIRMRPDTASVASYWDDLKAVADG